MTFIIPVKYIERKIRNMKINMLGEKNMKCRDMKYIPSFIE